MPIDITVPSMGESITEVAIGPILKPSGAAVKMDDELVEIVTDKVNQVLYASHEGVVQWSVQTDQVVKVGQVIGQIVEGASQSKTQEPTAPSKEATPKEATLKVSEVKTEEPKAIKADSQPKLPEGQPLRIDKDTFLKSSEAAVKQSAPVIREVSPETPNRRKMSKVRSVIAKRLVEVQQTTAMLTTFNEIDLEAVTAIRATHQEAFQKEHGVKLGWMSFFIKACVSALKLYPDFNAYIEGDEIVQRPSLNIGVAVGTDRGLFVPVLKNCEHLSFPEIEKSIQQFALKAKEGKLTVDDLSGGGFTITNGGTYGSLLSTPILSPNQCGILGMHKISKRPVVVNDAIVIRPMMYVALSYDHRLVDGKEAVSFLVHIKEVLEDPATLLLEF